ncbi:hypothetical protein M3Y99_00163200 [Aphelenchoides fujianensis]|nr:hypothetical protein M3Y99_00163200 [Aphelenchoides fujianensis]
MLSQLQDLFPDVVRRIYLIRYPSFLSAIWALITPVLSSQTQKKIVFLGADWKERLKESIDEQVLFRHWGGTREAATESLHYAPAADPNDLSELKEVNVRARNRAFVDVDVKSDRLKWWWQTAGGDLDFWVVRVTDDRLVWPKWRLLTESPSSPGLYRLFFDNSHGFVFSKTVKYKLWDGK